ncbi:MAG TPA: AGE family epimerase/isomerase, partial [Draconibacterium sp.]|nr:AGE family epimerase/isomerase [Draconibacterium sp.]
MQKLTGELMLFQKKFSKELHENILSFWMKYGVERNGHGFYGAVDLHGNPVFGAPKSCVLNARILWTFSQAAILFKNETYAEIADKAFKVLQEDFADKKFGGYFMSIDSENQPLDTI